jgi:hypothetical protein
MERSWEGAEGSCAEAAFGRRRLGAAPPPQVMTRRRV